MGRKPKTWSEAVEQHGIRVRLYERSSGGNIYREVRTGAGKDRKSLGHSDRDLARDQAKALATRLAELRLTGQATGRALTIGALFRLYFEHKGPALSDDRRRYGRTRKRLFLEAWGEDLPALDLSQSHVDAYAAARGSGDISPFTDSDSGRSPRPVRPRTVDADLRWLSSVYNWARRFKRNGRRLLTVNPLHDCSWPKEKNPRQPVASEQRFRQTLEHTGTVDPEGRLGCMLQLARYTGRRASAIRMLWASDVLRTREQVRRVLAAMGMDERRAEQWPHGAVRWRPESDKQGYAEVAPLSRSARAALDAYLRDNPRVGDVPLLPAPKDAGRALGKRLASRWLVKAEELASLPKLRGGVWHPYRRLWAVERKHLPDTDVAAAGGWRDTRALKQSYQQADADTMLNVVENGG